MISPGAIEQLPGKSVLDSSHQEIGPIDDVFTFTGATDAPAWAAVVVEGTRRPVPLIDAELHGDHLHVPYARDQVAGAPEVAEGETLKSSPELYGHYGISDAEIRDDTGNPATADGHARDQSDTASGDPRGGTGANDATQAHP